jgi:hypothetical protein
LDDDVLPEKDWVAQAYKFGKKHPKTGAWGSRIYGKFEIEPPKGFNKIERHLAIEDKGSEPFIYEPYRLNFPPSAALVVRAKAWRENVPEQVFLKGRQKDFPLGGEEYEALMHVHKAGWEIWYNPLMRAYHNMPVSRLDKKHLFHISWANGLATFPLRRINSRGLQKCVIFIRVILGSLKRTLWQIIKYRSKIKTDVVTACELRFFLASMISPFYFFILVLKSKILKR